MSHRFLELHFLGEGNTKSNHSVRFDTFSLCFSVFDSYVAVLENNYCQALLTFCRYTFRYFGKKDIKLFGATFFSKKVTNKLITEEFIMLEYKFDTQLLIERTDRDLDEDAINDYIRENIAGDCLIAAGGEDLVKIHFHTNTPWKVLEYCASLGEIYDIVVEDMDRQERGLKG